MNTDLKGILAQSSRQKLSAPAIQTHSRSQDATSIRPEELANHRTDVLHLHKPYRPAKRRRTGTVSDFPPEHLLPEADLPANSVRR